MAQKHAPQQPRFKVFDDWLAAFPPGKARVLTRQRDTLVGLFRDPHRTDLEWWHRVGVFLRNLSSAAESNYGVGLMELLADEVAPGRDRNNKTLVTQFYQFRDFARSFTWVEAKRLAARVRKGEITTQHVAYLLTVREGNRKTKAEFLELAVQHQWTANELQRAIQDDKRAGLRRYGGRRPTPRTKSSPGLAARDITVVARRWMACHKAYFTGRGPLADSPKKASRELLRELEAAFHGVEAVAEQAAAARKILQRIVQELTAAVRVDSDRKKR